ncbi:MAG: hypothetical protein VKJ24_06300 [Synechococcales bacterium]|nr:hypothetical protein [Synechococcales bacterium]
MLDNESDLKSEIYSTIENVDVRVQFQYCLQALQHCYRNYMIGQLSSSEYFALEGLIVQVTGLEMEQISPLVLFNVSSLSDE